MTSPSYVVSVIHTTLLQGVFLEYHSSNCKHNIYWDYKEKHTFAADTRFMLQLTLHLEQLFSTSTQSKRDLSC